MIAYTDHLPTHGCGPLWKWALTERRYSGRGVALSIGAYGWLTPERGGFFKWYPSVNRHPGIATHFWWGPVCLSFVFARY